MLGKILKRASQRSSQLDLFYRLPTNTMIPRKLPQRLFSTESSKGPIESSIIFKLQNDLPCFHLQVTNESHMHRSSQHPETHFRVVIVSPAFSGLSHVQRHRKLNSLLKEEFNSGVHALSLLPYTEDEWAKIQGITPMSPSCRGGEKKQRDNTSSSPSQSAGNPQTDVTS